MFIKPRIFSRHKSIDQHRRHFRQGQDDTPLFEKFSNSTAVIGIYRRNNGWVIIRQRGYLGQILADGIIDDQAGHAAAKN